jgi:hypothetical protein
MTFATRASARTRRTGFEESTEDQDTPRARENMMEPFPEKPKGMHLATYMRLFWEHHEAEWEHLLGVRAWLDKLQKQIA